MIHLLLYLLGIEYRNKGGGYYNNYYMHALTLPSGERVAAVINSDSVQSMGGKIVYEDLTQNEYFIGQIEYSEDLTRTDFYIDMIGTGGRLSQEDYSELPTLLAQFLTVIIAFPILHALGSKFGLFPYFFEPKEKEDKNL